MNNQKIIYYYQTFCGLGDIINNPSSPVTHIHLSSIHFGYESSKPYIHLNDSVPDSGKFNTVWRELVFLSKRNIKTILMIGGGGGAFNTLFLNFTVFYRLLYNTIKTYPIIKGVDLDIEEGVGLENVKLLINTIKRDFGKKFIISMAPMAISLVNDHHSIGGFSYKDLYNSAEGKLVNYYNCQFYGNFNFSTYDTIIKNGYKASKINIGMLSEEFDNNFPNALTELKLVKKRYQSLGGVYVWEYNNCPPDKNSHEKWADEVYTILNKTNNCIVM